MKKIAWCGDTHKIIKNYPDHIKQEIGYNLEQVQWGLGPHDWKPMGAVGSGVKEIRRHDQNEYRVLYLAKFEEHVYVLHAFIKKSQKTPKEAIALAKDRYATVRQERG